VTDPAAAPAIEALVEAERVNGLAYTEPSVFAAELDRIFHRGWVFVGHESEVPEAGEYVTRRLGRDPVEPVAPDATVHHHTPLLLAGVSPDFNTRVLRHSEAAMGPAGFLLPDDAAAAERMQVAFGRGGGWMDLSRGLHREERDGSGDRVGHVSDEVTTRGFWRHWREVMSA